MVLRIAMETLWFMIVAVMVAAYVVLDGFDLGAGAIYLGAGRTSDDRRKILHAIGPVSNACSTASAMPAEKSCAPSVPYGMAMKYGFWPPAERCISHSRCSMPPASAASIFRS